MSDPGAGMLTGVADPDYQDMTLAQFLDRLAEPTPAPSAGAVAATAVGLAAGLAAMSAGSSRRQLPDADRLVARAQELRRQVAPLAQRDATAYGEVLRAQARAVDDPGRDDAVREALSGAADVPLQIAEAGVEVLALAADVARRGNPTLRGDALTACLVAGSATKAAALLVELNLRDPGDPRRVRAAELARAAGRGELQHLDLSEGAPSV